MVASFGALGTASNVSSSSSCTPAYPSPSAGMDLWCYVAWCEQNDTAPSMPAGWTLVESVTCDDGVAFGADSGKRHGQLYRRDTVADGTEGTSTITITPNGSGTSRGTSAIIFSSSKTLTVVQAGTLTGTQNTATEDFNVTFTNANFGFSTTEDGFLVSMTVWMTDSATQTAATLTWSGSGASGTMTAGTAANNTGGNDFRWIIAREDLTGTGTGDLTFNQPTSGTASVVAGVILLYVTDAPLTVPAAASATATPLVPDIAADSNVTAVAATASAGALVPSLAASGTVDAVEAAATATAPSPTISGSSAISVTAVAATATAAAVAPAVTTSVSGTQGDRVVYSLNRLAGTLENGLPTLEAAGAANVWAGTQGLDLVGALNVKAGNTHPNYRELQGVLNQLAGTTGLGVAAAAARIQG